MIFNKYFIAAMLIGLLSSPSALAQESELEGPGITPDSPFYFLDKWSEELSMLFSFGNEAKAATQAKHAEERLSEAKVMADEGEHELAEQAANEYGDLINSAASNLAAAAKDGKDVSAAVTDLVAKASSIHQTVLGEVYNKVPEQAKSSIEQAMTKSSQGQEAALNAASGEQKEEVMQQVEQRRQEVDEKLDILRQEGAPIPEVPKGDSAEGDLGSDSAPSGVGQQDRGAPAGAGSASSGQGAPAGAGPR